jgi:hypothetical protein
LRIGLRGVGTGAQLIIDEDVHGGVVTVTRTGADLLWISSLMAHLSWGYLCLRSAVTRRKEYVLLALPMGMIDFTVPFAGTMPLSLFETLVFMLAALCVLAAVYVTRR